MDAPAATWLTHLDAAERLKVTPAMVVDAAGRMKWPSRRRRDDTPEVQVPCAVLAEADAAAATTGATAPGAATDAAALEAAIKMAVQPLQAVIEALLENARVTSTAIETLVCKRNDAQANAAGVKAGTTAIEQQIADLEPALERETRDRPSLQTQADLAREGRRAADERASRASVSSFREGLRREDVEAEIALLKREIEALKSRQRRYCHRG